MVRVAVLKEDKCEPKRCGKACYRFCPPVRNKIEAIRFEGDIPVIVESLCVGCGICVRKCPFKALSIINLSDELEAECSHRFGPNTFKLFRLPIPAPGVVLGLVVPLRAPWIRKAVGAALGSLVIYALNVARVVTTVALTGYDVLLLGCGQSQMSSGTNPSAALESKPRPYWNPEQPPPWIATRRTRGFPSGSSARSSLIFVAAGGVSEISVSVGCSTVATGSW